MRRRIQRVPIFAASSAAARWRGRAVALIIGGLWTAAGLVSFGAPAVSPGSARLLARSQEAKTPERTRSVWDGVYTEEQARRGRRLYQLHCADCHKPSEFTTGYPTAYDIFASRSEMPQRSPGALSAQEYADLIAYIFETNGMPSGKEELKGDPEALKQIRIEAKQRPGPTSPESNGGSRPGFGA